MNINRFFSLVIAIFIAVFISSNSSVTKVFAWPGCSACLPGGDWQCFPAGTKVITDSGEVNIEDVKAGDKVVSQTETGIRSNSTVLGIDESLQEDMCEIVFENSPSIKLTNEHPLMTSGGWKSIDPSKTIDDHPNLIVQKMNVGDEVVRSDNTYAVVKSMSCWPEKFKAYNLVLDGNAHTYFAGSYLAHNKTVVWNDCGNGNSCNIWSWTCFPAGTKVTMQDEQKKNIEEVKIGDKVVSQSRDGSKSISTVTGLDQPIREHMCRLDFRDGGVLKLTNEHPLMTQDGWKSITPSKTAEENPNLIVQSLSLGDRVVRESGNPSEITGIACWSAATPAYNLILDGNVNTYFADGYLAHNKGGGGGEPAFVCNYTSVNCPAGTVIGTTVLANSCRSAAQAVCKGSAQKVNGGCTCAGVVSDTSTCLTNVSTYNCCTPAAPSILDLVSPEEAASVVVSPGVSLLWSEPTSWGDACKDHVNSYTVNVFDDANKKVAATTIEMTGATSARFIPPKKGITYTWSVTATNGVKSSTSAVRSFFVVNDEVIGTVYYDADNNCAVRSGTADRWNLGKGMTVTLGGVGTSVSVPSVANKALSGGFTIIAQNGVTYPSLTLARIPAGYGCSNGPGCTSCYSLTDVVAPSATSRFYLTRRASAWWQVAGAGIYAGEPDGDVTVRSAMPTSATSLILPGANSAIGALLRASGSVELGSGKISAPALYSTKAGYKGKVMGYDFFSANMGVVRNQESDWTYSDAITLADYPANPEVKDFGYIKPVSGAAVIDTPWIVGVGEKYVVFVNGNLDIRSDITVSSGGFLSFIVSGDIIVDPAVRQIQGLYIADGVFRTLQDPIVDVSLEVEGTVVAWKNIELIRDMLLGNSAGPAEKFIYRPDLIENMPDKMKAFAMQWNEVVTGTYEPAE